MTSQFLAVLAAAGLVTAGVSVTAETRSASALPSVAGVAPARAAPQVDCNLDENKPLDVCKDAGKAGALDGGAGAAGGGGSSLLPVLLGVLGVGGIAAGLAGSSKG